MNQNAIGILQRAESRRGQLHMQRNKAGIRVGGTWGTRLGGAVLPQPGEKRGVGQFFELTKCFQG
ncbi:hypothetical protein EDS67_25700 [candidate division KSB1 bacterium]|nr:MAG: hypothetical protein EDS67_25700 [candidate division KSB1 bacterium]MBC6947132.1 hypothetical protein [candidate division KSB1 bacterium]MCE7944779.1 hypothetical protein [Chlorobi bacterium CHB1]